MNVLFVHNFYRFLAPSGENTAYLAELELLRQEGLGVMEFTRDSDGLTRLGPIGTIKGALSTPWNPFALRSLRRVLQREKPDIMHVHNTFPLLSPSIFHAARGLKTATVLTLHNYRNFCAAAIPMRNNMPCTACLDRRSVFPSLHYGCYRNSRLATIPLATMIALHRAIGTWGKAVDAFIVLTDFQREKLADAGLSPESLFVKPHFYSNPLVPLPWHEREQKIVFVGRLGLEKGVHILIDAWKLWGENAPPLEIIGDGPEREKLRGAVYGRKLESKIVFRGQVPFSKGQELLRKARLLVLPSVCFEGFAMVIREAFALGVPVAASRLGSIPYIISDGKNGVLFESDSASDLYRTVKGAWDHSHKLLIMGKTAHEEFKRKYTPEANYKMLVEIYQQAMEYRREKNSKIR